MSVDVPPPAPLPIEVPIEVTNERVAEARATDIEVG